MERPSRADFVTDLSPLIQRRDSQLIPKIEKAREQLRSRDLNGARETLAPYREDPNLVHPEVLIAELLAALDQPNEARTILEEFSVKEPKRVDVYLGFCELAVREQRWFEGWNLSAIGQRAPAPKPWSSTFAQQVNERLRVLSAICSEGRREWGMAREVYLSLPESTIHAREQLSGLARTSFHLGNLTQSLEHFQRLRKQFPETRPPELLIADLHDQAGTLEQVEAAYRQGLQAHQGNDLILIRLSFARWLLAHNRAKDVEQVLSQPIQDSAENELERQYLRALAARMAGRFSDAQRLLSGLHQKNPTNFSVSNQLALVLCQTEDESLRGRALQIAEGNARNLPRSSEAWGTLGWVQLQLGDVKSAEQSLLNASKLGPLTRDTLQYLRRLKEIVGDQPAIEVLNRALSEVKGPDFFP
jgi:tetratricopeptide (TPR) repeat protein